MPEIITIGPVLLPTQRTGLLVFLLLGIYLSGWAARRAGGNRADAIWLAETTVVTGLIAARLGFAALHATAYAEQPWTILYIWQPGFDWISGVLGAVGWVGWRYYRGHAGTAVLASTAKGFALPAVGIVALSIALDWSSKHGSDAVAGMLPPARMTTLEGERVDSQELLGRPVLINFWATWCPPCRREIPLLNRLRNQYAGAGLQVIGINVAENAEAVTAFGATTPLEFPVWLDPGHDTPDSQSLHARLRVRGLPTTYFISADGMIRSRYVGELSQALANIRIADLLE